MTAGDQQMLQPAPWDQQAEAQRLQQDSNQMMTVVLEEVMSSHHLPLPKQPIAVSETPGPMALQLAETRSMLRRTDEMLAAAKQVENFQAPIAVALAQQRIPGPVASSQPAIKPCQPRWKRY